jgi:hypothetical protein
MQSQRCPKCKGAMSEGFVIDNTHGSRGVATWSEGPPQKSFWLGVALKGKPLEIATWRCTACGYLENYANPKRPGSR